MGVVQECLKKGKVETARAIYSHALQVFPGKKSVWINAAKLEKEHGTPETLDAMLKKAVSYCPQVKPTCPRRFSGLGQVSCQLGLERRYSRCPSCGSWLTSAPQSSCFWLLMAAC